MRRSFIAATPSSSAMPVVKALIQLAVRSPVQWAWDGWFSPRDEAPAAGASGRLPPTGGAATRLSARAAYGIAGAVVVAAGLVDGFSKAQEVSWRLGAPGNLWEPLLWNATSCAVILALLPLVRRAAVLVRAGADRPFRIGLAVLALAAAYEALHIAGMFPLRRLAYAVAGWDYTIQWSQTRILYEARKDLFGYAVLAVIFWLAERPAAAPAVDDDVAVEAAGRPISAELWLRDGRTSILVDPREIVSVASAGNYVEYVLTGGRRHLIRTTLQAEEARLVPFGIVRVHRTRLVNVKRVVALAWRPSGDFEIRLDTGSATGLDTGRDTSEIIVGSRRFKTAIAAIGA